MAAPLASNRIDRDERLPGMLRQGKSCRLMTLPESVMEHVRAADGPLPVTFEVTVA